MNSSSRYMHEDHWHMQLIERAITNVRRSLIRCTNWSYHSGTKRLIAPCLRALKMWMSLDGHTYSGLDLVRDGITLLLLQSILVMSNAEAYASLFDKNQVAQALISYMLCNATISAHL
jgi:hypothetical protein